MKEHTLTKGSVGRGILLFVLPIIVGSLIQQLYVTIDAVGPEMSGRCTAPSVQLVRWQ